MSFFKKRLPIELVGCLKKVSLFAKKQNLGVYVDPKDHSIMLIRFPKVSSFHPILLTVDDGDTWTPEATKENVNYWNGEISLINTPLVNEIKRMFNVMKLGSSSHIIDIAIKICELSEEKILH